jgi:hypothetical protein
MMPEPTLTVLSLRRIAQLGQEVYEIHQQLMVWREQPLDTIEKTKMSVRLESKLQEQRQWCNALESAPTNTEKGE